MSEFKDEFKSIDKALDSDFITHLPIKKEANEILLTGAEEKLDKDYSTVRKNLYELIETGKDAVENILNVAKAGDSPRAYEVVSQLLKTVSEMNKDVLDVHDKAKKIKEENFENELVHLNQKALLQFPLELFQEQGLIQ